jgi:SAM-dependent methyltransferase
MCCDEGLHEKVMEEFLQLNPRSEARICILASGYGAFDRRLLDHGFRNIVSCDIEPKNMVQDEVNFLKIDFNKDACDLGEFDYIFAIEIIEHLENPFRFIRTTRRLLDDKGVLFLSTPNVLRVTNRAYFLFRNEMPFFNQGMLESSGHISPMLDHIIEWSLERNDLEVVSKTWNRFGDSADDRSRMGWKGRVFAIAVRLFRGLLPGNDGNITIYGVRKRCS